MVDIAAIKEEMLSIEGVKPEDLEFITDEYLAEIEATAQPIESMPGFMSGVWTGNHFVANGANWSWKDQPGSQCGQTRPWTYTRKPGDSYGVGGQCPGGYSWYNIVVV